MNLCIGCMTRSSCIISIANALLFHLWKAIGLSTPKFIHLKNRKEILALCLLNGLILLDKNVGDASRVFYTGTIMSNVLK